MTQTENRIQLADTERGPERTTATLAASLQARMSALYLVSGADALASITAGMAALGRQVSRTSEGTIMRKALESSRVSVNGRSVWSKLRLAEWTRGIFPAPVLEQLHNDVALMLADDLHLVLQSLPLPAEMVGPEGMAEEIPEVDFLDVTIGLWAFSRELVRCMEDLASMDDRSSAFAQPGAFGANGAGVVEGNILR